MKKEINPFEMNTVEFVDWFKEQERPTLSIPDYLMMLVIQSKQIRENVRDTNEKITELLRRKK